jgi:hypothetical protein
MRAARTRLTRGSPRLVAGAMAAGAVLGAFASPALAKTHSHKQTHQANAVKWCKGVASNENVTVNTRSEARSAAKLLKHWGATAPNATLKHNLQAMASDMNSMVAMYPHRPSGSFTANFNKLRNKVVSEVSSVCSAAGSSTNSGSGNSGNGGLGNSGNSGNSGNTGLGNSGNSGLGDSGNS